MEIKWHGPEVYQEVFPLEGESTEPKEVKAWVSLRWSDRDGWELQEDEARELLRQLRCWLTGGNYFEARDFSGDDAHTPIPDVTLEEVSVEDIAIGINDKWRVVTNDEGRDLFLQLKRELWAE